MYKLCHIHVHIWVNTLKTSISGNQEEEASRNRKITLFSPFLKAKWSGKRDEKDYYKDMKLRYNSR